MTTSLFFHLLPSSVGGNWLQWAAPGARFVKVCDAALIYPAQQFGCKVLYRPCFLPGDNGEGATEDGQKWAGNVIDQIASNGHHWPEVVQFRNEIDQVDANRVVVEYQKFRTALRNAGYPGGVGLGSYGVGWPDWPQYPILMTAQPDCLILDEYFGRTVAGSPDLALRHVEAIRLGLIPATLPLYIGECGSDRCGDGMDGRGWRDKLTPEQYAAQLAIYRAGCAPSVVAAFVFSDGDNGDPAWDSFKTRGTPVETAIRATWPNIPPQRAQEARSGQEGVPVASLPIPLLSQLATSNPNRFNECGEACLKMIAEYLGMPGASETIYQIDADERGDPTVLGYSSTDQAVKWFTDRGVPAVQSQPQDVPAALRDALGRGWPCLWLRYWDTAARTGGHFEVPIGSRGDKDGPGLDFNNPYGGSVDHFNDDEIRLWSLDNWLVVVQQAKPEVPTMEDPIITAARNRWSAANASIRPNENGALFRAYTRMIRNWVQSGQDNVLDPTPAIRSEWAAPDGSIARVPLDNGTILEWHRADGLVYQVEVKDRAAVYHECGWGQAA